VSGLYLTPDQMAQNAGLYLTPDELAQGGARGGLASGLTSLGPSAADFATLRDEALARIAPSAGTPGLIPPEAPAYYNPTSNQMFAGGRAFDVRDVGSALQAAQNLTPSAPPPGAGWQPLTGQTYSEFVQSLGRPRGIGENLTLGARGVAGGVVSGVGALAEMAGATGVGPAIMRAGETISGQDEFEKQRSALIQRSNSTFSNILDAAIQGVPSLVASGIAGLGGAAVGGLVGGPAGAAAGGAAAATLARARTFGAVGGAFLSSFPQQVSSIYEAAQNARTQDGQPAYNTNDTSTQLTILGAAFGTSLLDAIAPGRAVGGVSSALARAAEEAGQQAVRGMARARAVGGAAARSSLEEAATEATQTLVERAVFDPEFRRQLNANDWKALAPYIVEKYGEDILISAGAGALLGGGFGGAGRFIETRPRDILTDAGAPPATTPSAVPPAGGPPALPGPAPITPLPGGGPTPTSDLGPVIQPGALQSAEGLGLPVWNEQLGAYVLPTGPAAAPQQGPQRPGVLPREGVEQFGPTLPSLEGMVTALPPTGPQYGPLRAPPTMPAPQVFPTRPTLAPETFVTPGMERLRRPIPEAAAPTTLGESEAGNRLLALRRQMELQQAQAQAATQPQALTAAERDYEAALAQQREQQAQQAIQQGVQLSPTTVMTSGNRLVDNARRNLITRFNGLTAAEQDAILTPYDDNAVVFEDAVRRMSITQVRQAQAYLNDPQKNAPPLPYKGPSSAVQPAAAPAAPVTAQGVEATWRSAEYDFPVRVLPEAPQTSPDGRKYQKVIGPEGRETYVPADELVYATPTPAPTVQETQTNAPEVRQVEQGGVGQRADVGGRLASQGADRNVSTQNQEAGGQAGGGNRAEQGRAQQAKGIVATLQGEGIVLTADQRSSLNEAEKKITRYRALLNCLRTP